MTRHPLNWLLRLVPEIDRQAILGDLDEEYRSRVRPGRSRLGAEAWYAGQLIAAAWSFGWRDTVMTPIDPRSSRHFFRAGDVRYALRRWRRHPGFPLAATLTLGLGIGAATAMFSVIDAVLLRPLPWPNPDRLVTIHAVYPERRTDPAYATTWDRSLVHRPAWEALRGATSLEDVAVWQPPSLSTTIDEGKTQLALAMDVSSNFLPMLGVRLAHGRHYTPEDDEQDTWNVILSYEAWQRYFGGRMEIVGKPSSIAYAGSTYTPPWTVIGILEPGFSFDGASPDVLRLVGANGRRSFLGSFRALGRLAQGASIESASAEAAALIYASQPGVEAGARIVPLLEEQVGSSARPLWLLFGAAGVLLLVACTNVAGLLVGENRARRHEMGIRLALGVTRGGIVRQLVVEHALLAVAGATAGLVLAVWLTQAFVALAPVELPRLDTVRVDWRVALFALGAGGVTLLVFGLAPALSLARTRAAGMLAEGGREAAPARHAAQRTVVASEVALATVLVVGAGLLGETMFRLLSQPLGFDPTNLVVVSTRFTGSNIPPDWNPGTRGPGGVPGRNSGPPLAERTAAIRRARTLAAVERLSVLPGVVHASAMVRPPFSGSSVGQSQIRVEGRPVSDGDRAGGTSVGAGFARTLRVPLLAGRDLAPTDGANVSLVSREFERRYFPDGAVGRRFESGALSRSTTYDVVGVVADFKHSTVSDDSAPTYYAMSASSDSFVLRTAVDPHVVLPTIRGALAEVDPQIVVTSTTTMDAALAEVVAAERFRATLSSAFAGTALFLAVVGLYGVAARRVADRRRELGIRIALGARPENLRALVLSDGLRTVGFGLAVGLPAAFAASQLTRAFLFGVSPTAPHVFLIASLALAAAALLATILPARRAGRVDPIVALRE
jgi:putative ABC transport system permease protein